MRRTLLFAATVTDPGHPHEHAQRPSNKYRPFAPIQIPDRTWPNQQISKAPIWLSSDLRDGNQSLIEPMDAQKKMRFFKCLVAVGLKESKWASRPPRRPTSTSSAN